MTAKRFIPPGFTSVKARTAQRLALAARRVNDQYMRGELVERLPLMSRQLRQRVVDALGQRTVDALVIAHRQERGR